MTDLQYPIGKYIPQSFSAALCTEWLNELAILPDRIEMAVQGLDKNQLDTPYRPGGWTLNQVVHHLADSHMNGYLRTKMALTENVPTIKPYDQDAFSQLADYDLPFNYSCTIIHAVHKRWVSVWRNMSEEDFNKTFNHPENGLQTLWHQLGLYAWHGLHHTAHINNLRAQNNW
jgi:hypothetical protein